MGGMLADPAPVRLDSSRRSLGDRVGDRAFLYVTLAASLLAVAVWSFCRAYYFAFYVLERYVDPGFKFSGLGSLLAYCWKSRGRQRGQAPDGSGRDN